MFKPLLPVGSVVNVVGIAKSVMIFGRIVKGENKEGDVSYYEYMGCTWPDGFTDFNKVVFFDNTAITEVVFEGLNTPEENDHRHKLEYLRYQIANNGGTDITV